MYHFHGTSRLRLLLQIRPGDLPVSPFCDFTWPSRNIPGCCLQSDHEGLLSHAFVRWACVRTGFWNKYSDLKKNVLGGAKHCIMSTYITFTLHQIRSRRMNRCGFLGRDEKRLQIRCSPILWNEILYFEKCHQSPEKAHESHEMSCSVPWI
jgi:hypothetical protein